MGEKLTGRTFPEKKCRRARIARDADDLVKEKYPVRRGKNGSPRKNGDTETLQTPPTLPDPGKEMFRQREKGGGGSEMGKERRKPPAPTPVHPKKKGGKIHKGLGKTTEKRVTHPSLIFLERRETYRQK